MKPLILILFSFVAMSSALAQQPELQKDSIQTSHIQADTVESDQVIVVRGKGTYYASKFHGRRTANGEIFSNKKLTAAHLYLPFGTLVHVRNVDNGRTVEVRVNDRGPHNKNFIIDLSQAAAKEIGIYSKGVGTVEISYPKIDD